MHTQSHKTSLMEGIAYRQETDDSQIELLFAKSNDENEKKNDFEG